MKKPGMRGLFWKEWRENRAVPVWITLLMVMGIVVLELFRDKMSSPTNNDYDSTTSVLFVGWLLAAVIAGSGLISREVGSGSLQFLMAQPVSRRQVWWLKVRAGALVLLLSFVTTTTAWCILQYLYFGPTGFEDLDTGTKVVSMAFAGGAIGCFAVSLCLSSLMDRAISTALTAMVVCVGLMIPIGGLTEFAAPFGEGVGESLGILVEVLLLVPAFLAAAYWAFTRGESMRSPRRFWMAAAGGSAALAIVGAMAAGTCAWVSQFHRYSRLMDAGAEYNRAIGYGYAEDPGLVSADGSVVVLRVGSTPVSIPGEKQPVYLADYLVVDHLRGPAFHRVLPGGIPLAISPDNRYLVYQQTVGPLRLHRDLWHAPIVELDLQTGVTHRLANVGTQYPYSAAWSPDGRWLAVMSNATWAVPEINLFHPGHEYPALRLLDESGRRGYSTTVSIQSPRTTSRPSLLAGWSADSQYLYAPFGNEPTIYAIQPERLRKSFHHDMDMDYYVRSTTSEPPTPGVTPLFRIEDSDQSVYLQLSANLHRTLLVRVPAVRGEPGVPRPTPLDHGYVVDLLAAAEQAAAAHSGEPPLLSDWLARWAGKPGLPPAEVYSAISPDGQYTIAQLPADTHSPRRCVSLDLGQGRSSVLQLGRDGEYVPGKLQWFAAGHRFYVSLSWKPTMLTVGDPEIGKLQQLTVGDQRVLTASGDGHLLLSLSDNRPFDTFQPVSGEVNAQ